MAIEVRSTNTGSDYPASVSAGDLVVVFITHSSLGSPPAAPSGFTKVHEWQPVLINRHIATYTKTAAGGESGSMGFSLPDGSYLICSAAIIEARHVSFKVVEQEGESGDEAYDAIDCSGTFSDGPDSYATVGSDVMQLIRVATIDSATTLTHTNSTGWTKTEEGTQVMAMHHKTATVAQGTNYSDSMTGGTFNGLQKGLLVGYAFVQQAAASRRPHEEIWRRPTDAPRA